jgi:hypothetical protein
MEELKKDPSFVSAVSTAKELYEDPAKAQNILQQIKDDAIAAGLPGGSEKLSDAEIGLRELGKAARNPKLLADALEMLKDPETVAEVQAMMKDPAFQAEMKKYTEDPNFKLAMKKAAQEMEVDFD